MRITRARYHREIRHLRRKAAMKSAEKLSDGSLNDMWQECKRLKTTRSIPSSVDKITSSEGICDLFSSKYEQLYNSVPSDSADLSRVESEVQCAIEKEKYSINDYFNSDLLSRLVLHLNSNKKDGMEGLTSDYFIHAPLEFYDVLSMLFNSMLVHGFVPSSMISGVMIPIPKGKKSVLLSENYRAVALSSIASKLFELFIIEIERDKLITSNLQFGYKTGLSTTMCTGAMTEVIDYYVNRGSNVHNADA